MFGKPIRYYIRRMMPNAGAPPSAAPQAERTVIIVKQLQAHETEICYRGPAAGGCCYSNN